MAAHCVALLQRLYGQAELGALLGLLLPQVTPDLSMRIDNPALLIFGPERLDARPLETPRFRILEDSGLLTSSRSTPQGNVRVLLTGCQEKDAGHSHEDRGSIIVEAYGESLLNEVGMIDYQIPEHVMLGESRYHCIACPGPLDALPRQPLPTPGKILPKGSGDERRLTAEVDLAIAWGGAVRTASRRVESDSPEELTVIDSFGLAEERPVTVIFTTTGSIEAIPGGWRVRVGHAQAEILPKWEPARHLVTEILYNASKETCRALMIESAPARSQRLVTELRLSRTERPAR
jgi:hypothetical protein